MLESLGFKAWIASEGEVLQEYGVETNLKEREVTCWIPSTAGKTFKICWKNIDHLNKNLSGSVRVDGTWVGSTISRRGERSTISRAYVRISESTCRHFVFAPLHLTDDDTLLDSPSMESLGEIRLKLYEASVLKTTKSTRRKVRTVSSKDVIHEQSKKGIVHSVGFTPEVRNRRDHLTQATRTKVLARFVFKYRPLNVLQANDIAPRNQPLPTRAAAAKRNNKRRAGSIKEEHEVIELDDDGIELQTVASPVKTESHPAFVPGEVIDLT